MTYQEACVQPDVQTIERRITFLIRCYGHRTWTDRARTEYASLINLADVAICRHLGMTVEEYLARSAQDWETKNVR